MNTLPKNYRLVCEVLREAGRGTHLGMTEVYARAKQRAPAIGFTTVYRALARLRDEGLVAEIRLPGADMAYYEPGGETHAHFRCDVCGRVDDVAYSLPKRVMKGLARSAGVEVRDALISLHGRCAACVTVI